MTITESPAAAPARTVSAAEEPAGLYAVVTTGDHKMLGRLYVVLSFLFFLLVAVLGVLNGLEKVDTQSLDVFGDTTSYFQSFTLARLALVFLVVLPLFVGLATAVVPLQVGSPSIVFPRAATAAFWGWVVGSGVLLASFITDGGLGSLVEGSTDSDAVSLTLLGLGLVVVSLCLASVCIATTVIAARTPGMSLRRVPLFSWSMLVAATLWLVTLPVLLGDLVLIYVDYRHGQVQFGLPAAINQQVAWVFWQPQVYAWVIPVLGIMAEIVPVSARVRQRQHDVLLGAIALFGLLAFGAADQTFDLQDNFLYPAVGFAVLLPLLMVLGGWGDTLRQGRPDMKSPVGALLLGTAGVLLLLAGAAGGALRVLDPLDLLNTSATDGVFDLVLLAGVAGGAAGVVFWASKLVGRAFPEGIARLAALPLLGGAALIGIPQVIAGFLDQPGGIVDGPVKDGVDLLNVISVVGAFVLALGAVALLAGLVRTLAPGPRHAPSNPWGGHTLEWATLSPPPLGNFREPLPEVRSERPLLDPREADTGGAA
jgi:heme/copper-type cytochrome/quinol oxidase subunit 1